MKGRTVVCVASGPSLTQEDCELVRESGYPVIVTNTTVRMCPWADVLFAFDSKWWRQYQSEIADFKGEKLSASMLAENYGAKWVSLGYGNSGACAVALALSRGASRIVLLGYDLMMWNGRAHWHEDHPAPLENAHTMNEWGAQFERLARVARHKGVPIVNASRRTELASFPIVFLQKALREPVPA